MSQETITLRLNKNTWELFNRIDFLSKNGHRTKQVVIESLLRLGIEQLELAEQQIRAKSKDPYVVSILESDVMGTCMRCLGKNASGSALEAESSTVKHDCLVLPFVRTQEVRQ